MDKNLVLDLCAGTCSWSIPWLRRGYKVIAFDLYRHPFVPDEIDLRLTDIRTVSGKEFSGQTRIVLASPPCDEYARFTMPWTRAKNPPQPSLDLWKACERIAAEADAPLVLENVQTAQQWHGRARWHHGPFYLWGDIPAVMPHFQREFFRKKESYGSKQKDLRAAIPPDLAEHIASTFSGGAAASMGKGEMRC
jgi:site-specific DNA-cytosine methylase